MKTEIKILLVFAIFAFLAVLFGFYFKNKAIAASCGNGVCEAGENCQNCPIDCSPTCGNGICESACGENSSNCLIDCKPTPTCGNGVCEAGESCQNCSIDCGSCGATCGNGVCEAGEGPSNCCSDCYQTYYEKKCYDNDVYWYDCFGQRQSKEKECGDSGWSNEYRCLGNKVQRKWIERGCQNAQCYAKEEWRDWENCSLEGKVCVSGECKTPFVDLKVNNSDGPVELPFTQRTITISWTSQYLDSCEAQTITKPLGSNVNWSGGKSASGSESLTLDRAGSYRFKIKCVHNLSQISKSDEVQIFLRQPELRVITKGVIFTY